MIIVDMNQWFPEKQKVRLLWDIARTISWIPCFRCWFERALDEEEVLNDDQLQHLSKLAKTIFIACSVLRLRGLSDEDILSKFLADSSKTKTNGGGEGFVAKVATRVVGGVVAKVAVDKVVAAIQTSPPATCFEPYEKAAVYFGWLFVVAGMILRKKRPGLSTSMVNFGGVAVALFAVIQPMVGTIPELPPVTATVFGVVAAAIVVFTAALA